jgi:hypothetical protein
MVPSVDGMRKTADEATRDPATLVGIQNTGTQDQDDCQTQFML